MSTGSGAAERAYADDCVADISGKPKATGHTGQLLEALASGDVASALAGLRPALSPSHRTRHGPRPRANQGAALAGLRPALSPSHRTRHGPRPRANQGAAARATDVDVSS